MRIKRFTALFALLLVVASFASAYGATTAPKSSASAVQSFAPTGRVSDNVSFRITFKNQMVPTSAKNKPVDVEDFPFEVEPPIQAEGKWQNDRTFTARLLAPLKMATVYTAKVKPGLKDKRGAKVAEAEYTFQTDAFSPTDIQAVMDRDGRARFTMNFNMRVDPNRLKGFLTVLNEKGQKLNYSINGSLPGKSVTLTVPVERSSSRQKFTVNVAAGMTGSEGDLGLKDDFSTTVVLDPKLMVSSVNCYDGAIQVYFNFDVDAESIKDFVSIEPKESFNVTSSWSDNMINLRSDAFKPRSRFVVKMRRGLPAKGGLVLKEDFTQAVIMPDLRADGLKWMILTFRLLIPEHSRPWTIR